MFAVFSAERCEMRGRASRMKISSAISSSLFHFLRVPKEEIDKQYQYGEEQGKTDDKKLVSTKQPACRLLPGHEATGVSPQGHSGEARLMADQFKKMLPCPKIVRGQQELTTEQHVYARQFAQERITSMLSIEAVDEAEAEAEAHLSQVYHIAGLKPPQMRWFDSPMAFLLAYTPPKMWESLSASVQGILKSSVWKSQKAKLGTSVDDMVWESLEGSLGESRQDWVRNWTHVWSTSVWPSTWEGVGETVEDSVRDSLKTRVQESVSASDVFQEKNVTAVSCSKPACLPPLL